MVDETVFWRVMLRLECTEQRLLGTKNLDGTCWMLREREQATGMADQTCTNEVANECGEIGGNCVHAIPEVFCELSAVGGDGNDLVT